jgi:hypothetical protein
MEVQSTQEGWAMKKGFLKVGLSLLVMALALPGCFGLDEDTENDTGDALTCRGTFDAFATCISYEGVSYTEAAVSAGCGTDALEFSTEECGETQDEKALVGCCENDVGQVTENKTCYYGDAAGAAVLQTACEQTGTWSTDLVTAN